LLAILILFSMEKIMKTSDCSRLVVKLKMEVKKTTHHNKAFLVYNNKLLFPPIYFSRGNKETPPFVKHKIRHCLYLTEEEFNKLISCHISCEEYYDIRKSRSSF
jgi:hypothetical protein